MASPTRSLGLNGPQLNAVGLGTMSISGSYGGVDDEAYKFALFDRAHEIGQRFWDTADIYHDCEATIGKWFQRSGKRQDIFLASKFALDYSTGAEVVRSDPEYVKEACEKSLKTLGVETIDLYYCHRVDGKTPIEQTIEALVDLKREGKIRHIGLSEVTANTLRRAHAVHPIAALQVEYSPFSLDIESSQTDLLKTCRELGVTVIAYSPIGRGLLTGQIKSPLDLPEDDFRRAVPKFSEENFPKILDLVHKLEEVAKNHNTTSSSISIAWVLAQGQDIIPIPGSRNIKYIEANTKAAEIQLTDKEIKGIREVVDRTDIKGSRYPAGMMDSVHGETPPL